MRKSIIVAAASLLGACVAPGTETATSAPAPPPGVPANCPLRIDFASYGAGIDGQAKDNVEAMLRADRAVRATLCVRVRRAETAERLWREVRALIPANPRGPVSAYTRSGASFEIRRRGNSMRLCACAAHKRRPG